MKKFRFSLQTVHDLRAKARDAAEQDLAHAFAAVRDARFDLEAAVSLREQVTDDYTAALRANSLDAQDAALRNDFLRSLIDREAEHHAHIAKLEETVVAKREHLARLAREAQVTARLREQHLSRHCFEVARHEQNMLDEAATLIAARRHIATL